MKKAGIITLILGIMVSGNLSLTAQAKKVGVLILAHGGKHSSWDDTVKNATESLRENYMVEVAFGMANPTTMQAGIDKLESKGVTTIAVVPLFISSYSPIIRQNEYLLGLRDTLADPPMIMMHHGSGNMEKKGNHSTMKKEDKHNSMASMPMEASHSMINAEEKMELKPLHFKSKIILTNPLDAHPLVAEIIYDRISELSTNPINETILIVAHGPNDENDNKNWVKTIDNLADQIRTMQSEKGNKFKQIFGLTVRDDANPAIYEQAKEQLRTLVSQSGKDGEVIVVPLLLSQGGIEAGYVKRLEGLNYKWSGKTLLPHPNITKFIKTSVEEALKTKKIEE
ncbi:sirohydrochlorin chelatase [Mariniflexile sp.]|uniref:sirohydrochlorin chelatase n=1 Tax=Mariniflexile sp. TaxID=1979402 RepID=UPI004048961A